MDSSVHPPASIKSVFHITTTNFIGNNGVFFRVCSSSPRSMTFWRWKAPVYSLARRLPPSRQILVAERKNLSRLLSQFPPRPGLHLDIGSGTGDSFGVLPVNDKTVVIDAEFSMLVRNPGSYRMVARAEALPFRAQSFTFVSAIGLLEYVGHLEIFFAEMKRVLQPEGRFLFTSSPRNSANRLRWLWGEKLYFHDAGQVSRLLEARGWRLLGHSQSWLQEQWMAAPCSVA